MEVRIKRYADDFDDAIYLTEVGNEGILSSGKFDVYAVEEDIKVFGSLLEACAYVEKFKSTFSIFSKVELEVTF